MPEAGSHRSQLPQARTQRACTCTQAPLSTDTAAVQATGALALHLLSLSSAVTPGLRIHHTSKGGVTLTRPPRRNGSRSVELCKSLQIRHVNPTLTFTVTTPNTDDTQHARGRSKQVPPVHAHQAPAHSASCGRLPACPTGWRGPHLERVADLVRKRPRAWGDRRAAVRLAVVRAAVAADARAVAQQLHRAGGHGLSGPADAVAAGAGVADRDCMRAGTA